MKRFSRLLSAIRQGKSGLAARRLLVAFAACRRFLSLCQGQIRGGRKIIKRGDVYYVPLWLPVGIALVLASTVVWEDIGRAALRVSSSALHLIHGAKPAELAEFFAPSVQFWSAEIGQWAAEYEADPQLLATVMQIESCGHPTVISSAGAQGLFQVMPFHFAAGESMLDPDTNARRGADFLNYCHATADGVIGLALACYNGGPSVITQDAEDWSYETQKYFRWGVGIYSDAVANHSRSDTLDQWLAAGGQRLCASALSELSARYPAANP